MAEQPKLSPAPIVVFTALPWESAAVRAILQHVQREDERVWRGIAGSTEIIIVTNGIGPRRSQRTVDKYLETPLSAVLSVGCAGALTSELSCGQLVLAANVCMPATENAAQLLYFPANEELLAHTRTAAERAGIAVAEGALFPSAQILFTPEEKAQCGQKTGAIAVEMESGVHAAFAQTRGLPFLALRVILDGAQMRLPEIKGLTNSEGDVRAFKAAWHVATHPHHLPALLALQRARTTAAEAIRRICHSLFPLLV